MLVSPLTVKFTRTQPSSTSRRIMMNSHPHHQIVVVGRQLEKRLKLPRRSNHPHHSVINLHPQKWHQLRQCSQQRHRPRLFRLVHYRVQQGQTIRGSCLQHPVAPQQVRQFCREVQLMGTFLSLSPQRPRRLRLHLTRQYLYHHHSILPLGLRMVLHSLDNCLSQL